MGAWDDFMEPQQVRLPLDREGPTRNLVSAYNRGLGLPDGNYVNNADPSLWNVPWYQSVAELADCLPTDDPSQRGVLRDYCQALYAGNGDMHLIDTTGIDPAVLRYANLGVRKIRMQEALSDRKVMRSFASNRLPITTTGMTMTDPIQDMLSIRNRTVGDAPMNRENKHELLRSLVEKDLRKGGEGSRGGKVIAHTASGRAVYAHGSHTGTYTKKDHADAAAAHQKQGDKHRVKQKKNRDKGDVMEAHAHDMLADMHHGLAQRHAKMAQGNEA